MVKCSVFPPPSRGGKGIKLVDLNQVLTLGPEPSQAPQRAVGTCESLCAFRVLLHQGARLKSLTKVDGGGNNTSVLSGRVQNDGGKLQNWKTCILVQPFKLKQS